MSTSEGSLLREDSLPCPLPPPRSPALTPACVVAISGDEYKVAEPSAAEVQYFSSTEGILHVFDFDYEKIQQFQLKLGESEAFWVPFCIPCAYGMWHFFEKQNTIDAIRAKHVAITRDGIRYVVDRHMTGCRHDFEEVGQKTKTVLFDKITDCDIEQPAGASGPFWCLVQNTLTKVNIDTTSSHHELVLTGLKDPQGFKSTVWRMRRDGASAIPNAHSGESKDSSPPAIMAMSRKDTDVLKALNHQNELLCRQNELLEQIAKFTSRIPDSSHGGEVGEAK